MENADELHQGSSSSKSIEHLISKLALDKPKRFSHEDLISLTSNFDTKIGSGGFGNVYRGQFPNGVEVAVKVLLENDVVEEVFTAEVSTMGKTYHRNLVKLYGFCFDADMKALVYEYMKNGSLDMFLFGNDSSIKWEKLYEIVVETAKGLSYLHDGCYEQIIHHDIKPANVLIDANHTPKITDFGLAKLLNRDVSHLTMTRVRGTPGYAAPETFTQSSEVTYKCDVYSFGMMLFEILARRRNRHSQGWFPKQVWEKFENGQIDEIIELCGITLENRGKAMILCMVALWCIQFTPETRPSMSTVLTMLEKEIQVTTPPNPFLSSNVISSMQQSHPEEVIYPKISPAIDERFADKAEDSIHDQFALEQNIQDDLERNSKKTGAGTITPDLNKSEGSSNSHVAEIISKVKKAESILRAYPKLHPPGGDHAVIMYTSSKGQRRLVRESDQVRSIVRSHDISIKVIERDNWGDSSHNDYLRTLAKPTPLLFVNGRLIGGADKVKQLDKEGTLKILFDGLINYDTYYFNTLEKWSTQFPVYRDALLSVAEREHSLKSVRQKSDAETKSD